MLHHISFGVSEIRRAVEFYDAVLAALGYERIWSDLEEGSPSCGVGYGHAGGGDKFALKLRGGERIAPTHGFHLAFTAPSREAVNAFHEAALRHGGKDDGQPGLRPDYGPDYYAAFVIDPDGYRIEAVLNSAA